MGNTALLYKEFQKQGRNAKRDIMGQEFDKSEGDKILQSRHY